MKEEGKIKLHAVIVRDREDGYSKLERLVLLIMPHWWLRMPYYGMREAHNYFSIITFMAEIVRE